MSKQKNAFDIPKSSAWARELAENDLKSKRQSAHVRKERLQGREPMGSLNLPNAGKLSPKDRA